MIRNLRNPSKQSSLAKTQEGCPSSQVNREYKLEEAGKAKA